MTFFKDNVINVALPLSVVIQLSVETKGKRKLGNKTTELILRSHMHYDKVCMKLTLQK